MASPESIGQVEVNQPATDAAREKLRAERDNGAISQPAFLRYFHEPLGIRDFALEGDRLLKV